MIMNKERKKSYNPFKMWGSWVGLLAGFIIILHGWPWSSMMEPFRKFLFNLFGLYEMGEMLVIPIMMIVGFLLGWGIHSLFRRFRK